MNPIELLWNDLKWFLLNIARPKTEQALISAICLWWSFCVDKQYCNSKIDHLYKVIDECINVYGRATGF
jgi:hypothetical protein